MLDNTVKALSETKRKVKLISKVFSLSVQVIYLVYLAFCMLTGLGNIWINTALAVTASAYLVFDILTRDKVAKSTKKTRKKVSNIYRRVKLIYSLFPLLASVYGMYIASAADVKPISIITTTIMIILWVVRAVIELLVYIIAREIDILKEAFKADIDSMTSVVTKPVDAVSGFVKRVSGNADESDDRASAKFGRFVKGIFSRKRKTKKEENAEREEELLTLTDGRK